MFSRLTYYVRKKLLLAISMLLFSVTMKAQQDTVQEAPSEVTAEETNQDDAISNNSVHFSSKQLQANKGGPDSTQLRKVPDSIVRKLQAQDDFWYVNYPFQKKKVEIEDDRSIFDGPFFQALLWILIIGGFVVFLIIYLSSGNVGLFRRRNMPIISREEETLETDNIFEINYQREIDKAVNNGDYRLAIRLLYLRTLKNLSDRNIIQYKQDRTNFDYLVQLHPTKYYNDFFRVTRNYEFAWYGQFEIDPAKYNIIRNDFENFGHNLNNR